MDAERLAASSEPGEGICAAMGAAMRRGRARSAPLAGLALLWLALGGWLLVGLAGCAIGAPVSAQSAPKATPASAPTLPLPPMLGAYHIFVSDLVAGAVYSLGAQTEAAARSTHGLGLSPDGQSLYVTDVASNRLLVFHLSGGRLSNPHAAHVGAQPVHMVASPDGRYIFVTNFSGASVSVVDTTTWSVTRTIKTPAAPHSIVLSPDGRYIYVACYLGAAVAIIATAQQAVVGTIPLPAQARPYGLNISRDGHYLYTSDNFSGRLFTLDALTRRAITSTQVGLRPALIARSPDGATLYVANGASHNLSILDIASDPAAPRVIATTQLDGYPHGVSVTPDGRYVVVADTVSGNVSIVDALSHQVIATVTGMKYPNDTLALAA
jgi:YVTN family beta-propeller protein